MSRKTRDSGLDGILVIDKPAGCTSHDVVQRLRRATGQRRAGHTGTLDPDATGVLIVCFGRGTKLVRFLQDGTKTYAARMVLGVETTTQDAAGETVATRDASGVTEKALCSALMALTGEIEQVPPMVSAIKVDGERLHEKARRGQTVEREARTVVVHDLVLDDFVPGERAEASFLVTCGPGTYVRTLAHDAGRALGVGGSLLSLRRVANGGFTADEAIPLHEAEELIADKGAEAVLLGLHDAVRSLPTVRVDDPAEVAPLLHGQSLSGQGIEGPYAVLSGDHLVGIYADRDGDGRPEAVIARPEDLETSQ